MLRNRTKHIVNVTGTLANVLVPGMPALYLYEGQCIRTAVVKSILEVSTDYVRFETSRRIYNIYCGSLPYGRAKCIVLGLSLRQPHLEVSYAE